MVNRFAFVLRKTENTVAKFHSFPLSERLRVRPCKFKTKNQFTTSCCVSSADDEKYSNKQVISVTPRLYEYILRNVREPEVRTVHPFPLSSNSLPRRLFVFLFIVCPLLFWLILYFICGYWCFRCCVNFGKRLLVCVVARCRCITLGLLGLGF